LELENLDSDACTAVHDLAARSCVQADTVGGALFRLSGTETGLRALAAALAQIPSASHVSAEILGVIEAFSASAFSLDFPGGRLDLGRTPLIMGVLNVTPDSFSDGGAFFRKEEAVDRALEMIEQGADIVDVGGESTRPDAEPVSVEEELTRVVPVIAQIAERSHVPVSIDTYKSKVADEALNVGAKIVNDISALRFDAEMASVVAEHAVPVILMHILGTPRDMQHNPAYLDVVAEIVAYLRSALAHAVAEGISWDRTVIDPGIGFGKTVSHNLQIIGRLSEFKSLGRPILIGTSRKSFIGKVLGLEVGERVFGTAATVAASVLAGAHIVRVHDVAEMKQVARMAGVLRAPEQMRQATPDGVGAAES